MAQLRRFTTGVLPVFAIAACSQLIGLSEYEKGEEQQPDDNGGESPGGDGGKGGSSGTATGGRAGKGGTGGTTGGTGAVQGGEGGDGAVGGEGGQDEGGAAGSSTGGSRGGTAGRGGSGGKSTTGGTGGTGGAGIAGGGAGGIAGGGMGGSAGGSCMTVPVTLRGGNFDSDASAWASYGDPSARTIIVSGASQSITPQSAPNIAFFGGIDDWYAGHFQRISVPAGAVTMTLTGYRYVTTLETTTTSEYDDMQIQMWDDATDPTEEGFVGTFLALSNLDATGTWLSFSGTVAVDTRAGRTVDFDMWFGTDVDNVTTFYLDSLALTAFVCN